MNNAQLKKYKAPVITVVEIEAGGCLLDVSQIHVVYLLLVDYQYYTL